MTDKAKMMNKLVNSDEFTTLILNDFIKEGVLEYTLQHNIRSEAVLDQVMARQILHEYILGIISQGETPNT